MNSFDFLRKLYISSKSAVVITNSNNTIFWSRNLEKVGLKEEDITGENVYGYFKSRINRLYPCESIVKINGLYYQYNVKAITEKNSHDFIVLEIITEPISNIYIDDDTITGLIKDTQDTITLNTQAILNVVDRSPNRLSEAERNSIESSIKNIVSSNVSLASVAEIKVDMRRCGVECLSIANLLTKYSEICQAVFKDIDIDIDLICVEDVYGCVRENAFYNVCNAMLSRAICIAKGYVDRIVFSIELLNTNEAMIKVITSTSSGKVRVTDPSVLQNKLDKGNAVGTDMFNIRYFCREINGNAVERIDHVTKEVSVSVKIPNCESQGVTLFSCANKDNAKNIPNELYDKYGNMTPYSKMSAYLADLLDSFK